MPIPKEICLSTCTVVQSKFAASQWERYRMMLLELRCPLPKWCQWHQTFSSPNPRTMLMGILISLPQRKPRTVMKPERKSPCLLIVKWMSPLPSIWMVLRITHISGSSFQFPRIDVVLSSGHSGLLSCLHLLLIGHRTLRPVLEISYSNAPKLP